MVKKYDRQQDSNTQPFGFLTMVPPRISIVKGSKDSAYKKSARDGQNQEKEQNPTNEMNIFLPNKFFDKK